MKGVIIISHNPGLSKKAWDKLHKFLAEIELKHGEEIRKGQKKKEETAS